MEFTTHDSTLNPVERRFFLQRWLKNFKPSAMSYFELCFEFTMSHEL